ncbi:MAG: alpha-ketoglutarate-dependent dioxygenase AlkB [Pseudomonadota bacterium]
MQTLTHDGFRIHKGFLPRPAQEGIVAALREVIGQAPLSHYETPWGKRMSVGMSAAGQFGWVSERAGYRYADTHPSGVAWPEIPRSILGVWEELVPEARAPESCLINFYGEAAKMGLHSDDTEGDFSQPVVSISLGDPATFRMGGLKRKDPTRSVLLESGDVVVMEGESRLAYHGIDRIRFGRSDLLAKGGRINLTLRVVTPSPGEAG